MSFAVESSGPETAVVRVGETLTFRNAVAFRAACLEQARAGTRHFILDFSETRLLDSKGMSAVFSLHRQLSGRTHAVVFASVSPPVQAVVELTRIHRLFPQFPTVEEARRALA